MPIIQVPDTVIDEVEVITFSYEDASSDDGSDDGSDDDSSALLVEQVHTIDGRTERTQVEMFGGMPTGVITLVPGGPVDGTLGGGRVTTYTYDGKGRLTDRATDSTNLAGVLTRVDGLTLTYDNGNLVESVGTIDLFTPPPPPFNFVPDGIPDITFTVTDTAYDDDGRIRGGTFISEPFDDLNPSLTTSTRVFMHIYDNDDDSDDDDDD